MYMCICSMNIDIFNHEIMYMYMCVYVPRIVLFIFMIFHVDIIDLHIQIHMCCCMYICIYMYVYVYVYRGRRKGWKKVRKGKRLGTIFQKIVCILICFSLTSRCIGGALVQWWVHDQEGDGSNPGQNPFCSFFRRKIPAYGRAKFAGNSRHEEESRTGKNRQF